MKKKWQFQDLSLARIYKNEDGDFILYSSEYPTGINFSSSHLLDNLMTEDFLDADDSLELDDYLYEDGYFEFEYDDEDDVDVEDEDYDEDEDLEDDYPYDDPEED